MSTKLNRPVRKDWGERAAILSKYAQVRHFLLEGIRTRRYAIGDVLPSESELIEEFGVSRVTVRRALSDLSHDGFIRSQQGMPHIVCGHELRPTIGLIYGNQVYGPNEILSYRLLINHFREMLLQHRCAMKLYCVRSYGHGLNSDREQLITDIRRNLLKGLIAVAWPAAETESSDDVAEDHELKSIIQSAALPLSGWTGADLPGAIALDYESVGYLGAKHLLQAGWDRVALICGSDSIPEQPAVLVGYRRALNEQGVPFRPELVCRINELSKAAGYAALRKLWKSSTRPQGVVVADDVVGQGVVTCILELKIEMPRQLEMATLHIKGKGVFCPRPFVKLEIDLEEPARQVCSQLFETIRNPQIIQGNSYFQPKVVPSDGSIVESQASRLVETMLA